MDISRSQKSLSLIQVHGPPSGRWLESQRARGLSECSTAAKLEGGYRSLDALLRDLLADYRRGRLREAGELLHRKRKEKGLTLRHLIR